MVVVGGGLAGITAALALADAGLRVTLKEARGHLGGRVGSVKHPRLGIKVDNCQHAAFRVYDRFFQLLGRADARDVVKIQSKTNLPFALPSSGRIASLTTGRLSPPNHMIGSMLKFPFLNLKDKLAMRSVVKAFSKLDDVSQWEFDDITFKEWLESKGQTQKAIERFFGFFTLAALNISIEEVSAAQGIMLFRHGLFGKADAFDVVSFTKHLGEAIDGPLTKALLDSGVNIEFNTSVKSMEELSNYDGKVIALPPHLSAKVCGISNDLEYRALIGIHAFYRGNVVPDDFTFAAMIDEPLIQIIFNRSQEMDSQSELQWISIPVSAADPFLKTSDEEILNELDRVLKSLYPNLKGELVDYLIVKTPKSTFAPTPGSAAKRPKVDLLGDSIAIAGSHTMTGWPSTMEGAVRSGLQAAAHILGKKEYHHDQDWQGWPARPSRGDNNWREW